MLAIVAVGGVRARAEAEATAEATTRISGWAGASGNFTGVQLAKNAGITAGVDVGFKPFFGFYPTVEGRGMYPVAKGNTVAEENLLGGLKLGRSKNRFHGYGDILYGRGKLTFADGGYPNATNTYLVLSNTTGVLSLGGGVDWDWTSHFGLKGDVQLQRYQTPVTASGDLYSKVFTLGLIYRVKFSKIR